MFSEQELAFLRTQRLARIATVAPDGQPTVDAVGFSFDGTHFYVGGQNIQSTRKYKNVVAGNTKVSLVIDELKSVQSWLALGIRVHGEAEAVETQAHFGPGLYLVITPTVSWSWGMKEPGAEAGKGGAKKTLWSSPQTASGESQ
jgi:pyridoxamine 5'-phosphate oxidase family protein